MQTEQKGRYFPMHVGTNPFRPSLAELPPPTGSVHVPLVLGRGYVPNAQRHDQFADSNFGRRTRTLLMLVCEMATSVASYSPRRIGKVSRIQAAETVILNSAGEKIGFILSVFFNIFNDIKEDADLEDKPKGRDKKVMLRKNQRDPACFLESKWRQPEQTMEMGFYKRAPKWSGPSKDEYVSLCCGYTTMTSEQRRNALEYHLSNAGQGSHPDENLRDKYPDNDIEFLTFFNAAHPFRVFTLANAIQQFKLLNDRDQPDEAFHLDQWAKFKFPAKGKYTYSISPSELKPELFLCTLFPTAIRPKVDEHSVEFQHQYSFYLKALEEKRDPRFEDGDEHEEKQLRDDRYDDDDDAVPAVKEEKQSEEEKRHKQAREMAIMYISNNASTLVGLSDRPALRARIGEILKRATEPIRKKIAELEVQLLQADEYSKESLEQRIMEQRKIMAKQHREAQLQGLHELQVIWQQPRGINHAYQCIRKFMEEYLTTYKKKNFSLPRRKLYKNLTSFGELMAMQMLDRESFGLDYRSHLTFVLLCFAMLKTYIRDNMQVICLLLGKHSTGKSNIMRNLMTRFIKGTIENMTGSSNKADLTEDVFDIDDKITRVEEADPIALGLENSTIGQSGRSQQALNAKASVLRATQTELTGGYKRLEKGEDNKFHRSKFEHEVNKNSVQGVNAWKHQLPHNVSSRYLCIEFKTPSRPDRSFIEHCIGSKLDRRAEYVDKLNDNFRVDQALIATIGLLMDLGLLKRPDTTLAEQQITRVLGWASEKGMATADDLRTVDRARKMVEIYCIYEAIHRFFHSEHGPVQDKTWSLELLLDIQPLLVCTYEHSTFALCQFKDQFMSEVSYHAFSCINIAFNTRFKKKTVKAYQTGDQLVGREKEEDEKAEKEKKSGDEKKGPEATWVNGQPDFREKSQKGADGQPIIDEHYLRQTCYTELELGFTVGNVPRGMTIRDVCKKITTMIMPFMKSTGYEPEVVQHFLMGLETTMVNIPCGKKKLLRAAMIFDGCRVWMANSLLETPKSDELVYLIKKSLCEPYIPKRNYTLGTTDDKSGVFCLATWSNDPDNCSSPENRAEIIEFQKQLLAEGIVRPDGITVLVRQVSAIEPIIVEHLLAAQMCERTEDGNALFEKRMANSLSSNATQSIICVNMNREDYQLNAFLDQINYGSYYLNNANVSPWTTANSFLMRPSKYQQHIEQDMKAATYAKAYPDVYESHDAWCYLEKQKKKVLANPSSLSLKSAMKNNITAKMMGWADEKEDEKAIHTKERFTAEAMGTLEAKQQPVMNSGPSDDDLLSLPDTQSSSSSSSSGGVAPMDTSAAEKKRNTSKAAPARDDETKEKDSPGTPPRRRPISPSAPFIGLISTADSNGTRGQKRKAPETPQKKAAAARPLQKSPAKAFCLFSMLTAVEQSSDEKKTENKDSAPQPKKRKLYRHAGEVFGVERSSNEFTDESSRDSTAPDDGSDLADFVVDDSDSEIDWKHAVRNLQQKENDYEHDVEREIREEEAMEAEANGVDPDEGLDDVFDGLSEREDDEEEEGPTSEYLDNEAGLTKRKKLAREEARAEERCREEEQEIDDAEDL